MVIQCAGRVAVPRFESLGAYSRTGHRLVFLLEEVPRRAQGFLIHALGHARTSFQIDVFTCRWFESTAWHWVLWHHSWGLASPVGLTTKKALANG